MAQTIADLMAQTLRSIGVRRIYGVVDDSLNGFTDVLRRQKEIQWVHVRHEEVAAFAAGAEVHLTGELRTGQPAPDQWPFSIVTDRACRCSQSPRRSLRPRSVRGISKKPTRNICSASAATIAN